VSRLPIPRLSQPLKQAVSLICGSLTGVLPLDPATFEKVDETFGSKKQVLKIFPQAGQTGWN